MDALQIDVPALRVHTRSHRWDREPNGFSQCSLAMAKVGAVDLKPRIVSAGLLQPLLNLREVTLKR